MMAACINGAACWVAAVVVLFAGGGMSMETSNPSCQKTGSPDYGDGLEASSCDFGCISALVSHRMEHHSSMQGPRGGPEVLEWCEAHAAVSGGATLKWVCRLACRAISLVHIHAVAW